MVGVLQATCLLQACAGISRKEAALHQRQELKQQLPTGWCAVGGNRQAQASLWGKTLMPDVHLSLKIQRPPSHLTDFLNSAVFNELSVLDILASSGEASCC